MSLLPTLKLRSIALASCLGAVAACTPGTPGEDLPDAWIIKPLPDGGANAGGSGTEFAATQNGPYAIVLAHGLFGVEPNYFYGVDAALRARGRTVFAPQVNPVDSSDVRGPQLLAAVEAARATIGGGKVVIIAHSQGGMDAKYVAAHDPDAVAAVVTIGTPHHGTLVADVALGLLPGDSSSVLDSLAHAFGYSGPTNFDGALTTLSSAGAAKFNLENPDAPGIPYWSIAGRSNGVSSKSCPPSKASFVSKWDSQRDTSLNAQLIASAILFDTVDLFNIPVNDGVVTVGSAEWDNFLGCIPADHLDEICNGGSGPGGSNKFNCVEFYEDLESFLSVQGY